MATTNESKTAVITGAAGGLGACYTRKLAERGFDLLLVDRREEQIAELGGEVSAKYSINAEVLAADLTDQEAVKSVARKVAETPALELLVNNAGFGLAKFFVDADVERHLDMIRVHVLASVRLTRAALPGMIERDRGAIVNMSSLCAWTPCAGVVPYSSTKAFLTVFSEGIQDELRDTNVRIQALCPGFVYTDFHATDDMKNFDPSQVPKSLWMTTDEVVEYSLKCLSRKQVIVVPGWRNRVLGRFMRMPVFQPLVRALVRQDRGTTADTGPGAAVLSHDPTTAGNQATER